ncbi:hypothetical protein [Nostoc cycadae]|uniref:Uncharacterized protein n=1 Tax=Nostoc cycadae WK-1 TaxID=1861711 RepID=A0A2H6LHD8_9NOSO|nr:hypothetical protein [Nostoc cycadae]GBE92630.1 hypothetical protein NCWK1_2386 [Nostoc cycadae WK-1]
MANSSPTSIAKSLVFPAILSLIVSVTGGILVFRTTDKKAGLNYNVDTSAVFTGQTKNISIISVMISNPEQKEVEDVRVVIPVEKSQLTEYKVVGIQSSSYSQSSDAKQIEIKVPYLNPKESFSIQILLSPNSPNFSLSSERVIVRGKGVSTSLSSVNQDNKFSEVFSSVAAALISLIILSVPRFFPSLLYTSKHSDDQRDIMAYILGANGFYEEASHFRNIERDTSYWALSDYLAEKCIESGDKDKTQRGIKCLSDLLSYASMEDTSELLIHYNLSRLSAIVGDLKLARDHLELARKGRHRVIEMRISFDKNISQIL